MSRNRRAWIASIILVLMVIAAIPAASDSGWRLIEGYRVQGGDRVDFLLRYDDAQAVLVESRGGEVERVASCTGGTYLETYGQPSYTVRRDMESREVCLESATASLLGFRKLALAPGHRVETSHDGHSAIRVTDLPEALEWSEVILDAGNGLPLRAVPRDGSAIDWHYDRVNEPTAVESMPERPSTTDELYVALSRAEAGLAANLPEVPPASIGKLRFDSAFSYIGGQLESPRVYIIWSSPEGQVQFIVSPGKLPPGAPSVEDLGNAGLMLNAQDSNSHTQIFATSKALLQDAVDVLRPDLASVAE